MAFIMENVVDNGSRWSLWVSKLSFCHEKCFFEVMIVSFIT